MNKATRNRQPTEIDQDIAWNVWRYRVLARKTMADLSREIGIAYQQWCRYEACTNRIPASRLAQIAKALDVPIECFFQPLPSDGEDRKAA